VAGYGGAYRLVVQSPDGDSVHADLGHSMTGVGEASTIHLNMLFAGLKNGGQGATLQIVKLAGFGPHASQQPASNTIPLDVPAAGSGKSPPPVVDPEHTPPDDLARDAVIAWRALQQEFGKAKIAVLRLEGGEKLDITEGVHEKVERYKASHPEAKVFEILDKKKPVILVAPTTDLLAAAKEFDLGAVDRTDSFQGVAFVTLDKTLFGLNDLGIMEDESHPDYFAANFKHWDGVALKSSFGELVREAGPSIKRLAKSDPQKCPEEIRDKIGQRFESLFNSDQRFGDQEFRCSVIEGYALWAPRNAGADLASALRELARENFFAKEQEAESMMDQLGKLQESSAVDTLVDIIASASERGRRHDQLMEPAADALIAIGSASEVSVHKLVRNNDPDVCLIGIRILAEVGTKRSLDLLGQAVSKSPSREIRDAARAAMREIRQRPATNPAEQE